MTRKLAEADAIENAEEVREFCYLRGMGKQSHVWSESERND